MKEVRLNLSKHKKIQVYNDRSRNKIDQDVTQTTLTDQNHNDSHNMITHQSLNSQIPLRRNSFEMIDDIFATGNESKRKSKNSKNRGSKLVKVDLIEKTSKNLDLPKINVE